MNEKIKCNSCGEEHLLIFKDNDNFTQADDCASDVYFDRNEIICYYGSFFDFNVYEFVDGEVPDWVESGLICDKCIEKLLYTGEIELKRRNTI